jgi:hypothetical protein
MDQQRLVDVAHQLRRRSAWQSRFARRAAIINRLKAQGTKTPEQLVTNCLDLLGPVEVGEATRKELTDAAKQWGDISWDSDASAKNAAQRAAEMMQLIAATREYQFG